MYKMTDIKYITMTAADAKARFAESIRRVEQGEVVLITRHGEPVAALVTPSELEELARLRSRAPADALAGLVGRWKDSDELVRELDRREARNEDSKRIPSLE